MWFSGSLFLKCVLFAVQFYRCFWRFSPWWLRAFLRPVGRQVFLLKGFHLHQEPMKIQLMDIFLFCGTAAFKQILIDFVCVTLPETTIAPENGWLESSFPFGPFSGAMLVSGREEYFIQQLCLKWQPIAGRGRVLQRCHLLMWWLLYRSHSGGSYVLLPEILRKTRNVSCNDLFIPVVGWINFCMAIWRETLTQYDTWTLDVFFQGGIPNDSFPKFPWIDGLLSNWKPMTWDF